MSTSSQYLSVPQSSRRPSQHRNNDRGGPAQSPQAHNQSVAAGHAASSSKVKLEDSPLGIHPTLGTHVPYATPAPTQTSPVQIVRTLSPTAASSISATLSHTPSSPPGSTVQHHTFPLPHVEFQLTFAPTKNKKQSQQSQRSPRRLFRAMPFLVRLRSPRSDLLSLSCTSGAPRTHVVLSRAQFHKASQPLTYSRTLVCADGVNAQVLLRFARNEIFERAQQANRHVTALVDEEWQYTIRQTKSGDYSVQVRDSAISCISAETFERVWSNSFPTRHAPHSA
jgi:hypothetical protein